mmetsp:Transcript_8611/g.17542  ORF Transcript_8611/g.17542 Transcript_8611/m.17542 type:complete len:275 (-) Transcript_8611:208-1032(-)
MPLLVAGNTVQVYVSVYCLQISKSCPWFTFAHLLDSIQTPGKDKNQDRKYKLSLVSTEGATDGTLYSKRTGDASQVLQQGSRLGVTYNVLASLSSPDLANSKRSDECDHVRTSLGVVTAEWAPIKLPSIDYNVHGPLPLLNPSKIKFLGPSCYIERAPFEAKLMSFPDSPKVAVPFEVKYSIKNQTLYDQKLSLLMSEARPGDNVDASDTVLVSGFVCGEVQLAPLESRVLCYSALAMRSGKTPMPALSVSSLRYKSWVINDGQDKPHHFYVLP